MAAAPLEAEGAEVAANFARFAAALDDTLKVVSKPKEWKADEQTAAHWARWSFQMKNYFALLHVQMQEWLTIVEATDSEEQLDILRMTPYEKMYSRVIYSILVQVLTKGHCATLVLQRQKDMNGFRLWRRLKEEFEPQSENRFHGLLTALLEYTFPTDRYQLKASILKYEIAIDNMRAHRKMSFRIVSRKRRWSKVCQAKSKPTCTFD